MASITIKSLKKINSGCSNGFEFDMQDYRQLGNTNLSKTIPKEENKLIKATLYYQDEIIDHRETGQRIPTLNVSLWTKSSKSVMWSSGTGKYHTYKDRKTSRRNISVLQAITAEITDEFIKRLAVDNQNLNIL